VDGSSPELINEDDPVVINIHGDKMLYVGINFMDFSLKQTMVSTDGSLRKDFNMNIKPRNKMHQFIPWDKWPWSEIWKYQLRTYTQLM